MIFYNILDGLASSLIYDFAGLLLSRIEVSLIGDGFICLSGEGDGLGDWTASG